jgi:hypothetical protein
MEKIEPQCERDANFRTSVSPSQHVVGLYRLHAIRSRDGHVGVFVGAELSYLLGQGYPKGLHKIIATVGGCYNLHLFSDQLLNGRVKLNSKLEGNVEVASWVGVNQTDRGTLHRESKPEDTTVAHCPFYG